jgi:WD40 repeat protein
LAFTSDGKFLASSSVDHGICLWDLSTHKIVATVREVCGGVGDFALSSDGKSLVAFGVAPGTRELVIVVYDVKSRKCVRQFAPPRKTVGQPLCITPDGKTLILGGWEPAASLVDLATGKEVATLPGKRRTKEMALSPNGKLLAIANQDNTVTIWDLPARKLLHVINVGTSPLCVAFSPDGKEITAGLGNGARTWLLHEKPEVKRTLILFRHTESAMSLAYSPDGKTLAVVGFRPGVVLWDLDRNEARKDFDGKTPKGDNRAVAFSPDGRAIASGGSEDTDILLWNVPPLKKTGKK